MRKIIKYIPILASILCSIFMFSIGFSSWLIIFVPETDPVSGSFASYDVNEYVVCESGPAVFNYTSLYFIESGREEYGLNTPNKGYITVLYNFTDTAKAKMTEGNGLTLTFNLWYQDAKPDADGNQPKIFTAGNTVASLSASSEQYKPSATTDRFSFDYTFKADSVATAPDTVTVTYTFTTTVGQGFRAAFGQYLLNNKDGLTTKFVTSAEAEVAK
ncbi:MAG: hypothetical protein J6Q85_07365 [Clostridia bacterium]|nr:hypothetical protein [Clostridia bacterium]